MACQQTPQSVPASVPSIAPELLPAHAAAVLHALEGAGYEAWLVGGWVRDALRGVPAHDVDICTNASWQMSKAAAEAAGLVAHETGVAHGTVTVIAAGEPVEVTTYRVDGAYSDSRHPDKVQFVSDIREDLARRDFTINAMAWHPKRGLLDLYGGASDLAAGLIRAVGDPFVRFDEDALRVLRAVRFACRFGFDIEPATQAALTACAPKLASVASERIGTELRGIVNSGHLAWALRHEQAVMNVAVPSLVALQGFDQQSPYHCFDVYEHTVRVCEGIEYYTGGLASERLRWAAMLHDVGKPECFTVDEHGQGHFYGHPHAGAAIARKYLRKLAIPGDLLGEIVALVRLHDRPMDANVASELALAVDINSYAHAQSRSACVSLMHEMLDLRRADALAKSEPYRCYATELDEHEALWREVSDSNACWCMADLALSGADVIETLDIAPGPEVGECLKRVLAASKRSMAMLPHAHWPISTSLLSPLRCLASILRPQSATPTVATLSTLASSLWK